jgi:hypothetical protein
VLSEGTYRALADAPSHTEVNGIME